MRKQVLIIFWTPAQLTLYTNPFRICFCSIETVSVLFFVYLIVILFIFIYPYICICKRSHVNAYRSWRCRSPIYSLQSAEWVHCNFTVSIFMFVLLVGSSRSNCRLGSRSEPPNWKTWLFSFTPSDPLFALCAFTWVDVAGLKLNEHRSLFWTFLVPSNSFGWGILRFHDAPIPSLCCCLAEIECNMINLNSTAISTVSIYMKSYVWDCAPYSFTSCLPSGRCLLWLPKS